MNLICPRKSYRQVKASKETDLTKHIGQKHGEDKRRAVSDATTTSATLASLYLSKGKHILSK